MVTKRRMGVGGWYRERETEEGWGAGVGEETEEQINKSNNKGRERWNWDGSLERVEGEMKARGIVRTEGWRVRITRGGERWK